MGNDRTIILRNSPNASHDLADDHVRTVRKYRDELINMAGEYMSRGMKSECEECLAQAGRITHSLARRQRVLRRYGC